MARKKKTVSKAAASSARSSPKRSGPKRSGPKRSGRKPAARKPKASASTGLVLRRGDTTGQIQPFGVLVPRAIALPTSTCASSVKDLNGVLANTLALRDLYRKCHWQTSGPTFGELHELFDRHYGQQDETVDLVAERISTLGGVSIAMPHDVAETTAIPRPPLGREPVAAQLKRLLEAHEIVIRDARRVASRAADHGDDGTNDLIVGQVIRGNEKQAWFISEHASARS